MRTLLLALAILMALAVPTQAQHPCDAFAPYYHRQPETSGPGSLLGDVFFFAFSAPMAAAIAGGPRRDVVNPQTGERRRVSSAACMPISLVRHYRANQPAHAEHWQVE